MCFSESTTQRRVQFMEYFLRDFLPAAVPSSVSKTIAAPLEAVKLRAQLSDPSGSSSILEMVNVMYQEEGLGVFFAGNCVNCARYFPMQMTNFLFKDLIKRLVEKSLGEGYLSKILAGTLAGTLSTLMVYPLDNWRTQALSKSECSSGMESSSLFDVYSGFGMSVLGIGLYRFSYFAVHDGMCLLCEGARVCVCVCACCNWNIVCIFHLLMY